MFPISVNFKKFKGRIRLNTVIHVDKGDYLTLL